MLGVAEFAISESGGQVERSFDAYPRHGKLLLLLVHTEKITMTLDELDRTLPNEFHDARANDSISLRPERKNSRSSIFLYFKVC